MDAIVDLVQQLEPEVAPPSAEAHARQREALLQSIVGIERSRTPPHRWRPRHMGLSLAVTSVVAVAIALAILYSGFSTPRRQSSPRSPAVFTAITRALASTTNDIEEVRSTSQAAVLSTTSWVDVASGACRTDVSVNGTLSRRLFDDPSSRWRWWLWVPAFAGTTPQG